MIIHTLTSHNWPQPCIIDCHARIGLFWACLYQVFNEITELWNKESHEIDKWGNTYDQSTNNWQHLTNIHFQWYKIDTLKNLKLHFNMSLIVCIKKATKCVVIFSFTEWLELGSLCWGVSNISFIKLFMNTLI